MIRQLITEKKLLFTLLLPLMVLTSSYSQHKTNKGKVYTVEIIKMKFVPSVLTVKKGDKVVWINKDFYPHDVTDELKTAWSSKPLGQNQSWSKVITKNESYFCNLHKMMKGKIIVK